MARSWRCPDCKVDWPNSADYYACPRCTTKTYETDTDADYTFAEGKAIRESWAAWREFEARADTEVAELEAQFAL